MATYNFELTISGLVVLAVKSATPRPVEPQAVDIICPNAEMHRPRLSYDPLELDPRIVPEMAVATDGHRLASFDTRARFLRFSFASNPHGTFRMYWEDPAATAPADPGQEPVMNWLPSLGELGFGEFTIPAAGVLPAGASTRIALPPGEIICRDVVKKPKTTADYLIFKFPATDDGSGNVVTRALANDVVYRAQGVSGTLSVEDHSGLRLLTSEGPFEGDTLRMCISNDLEFVPRTFRAGSDSLKHLHHLSVLAPVRVQDFEPPVLVDSTGRTGDVICNGAIFIHDQTI